MRIFLTRLRTTSFLAFVCICVVIISQSGGGVSAFAGEVGNTATTGQALIILKSTDLNDMQATIAALEDMGVHVNHVIGPRVLITRGLSTQAEQSALAISNVASVHRSAVAALAVTEDNMDLATGVSAWNYLLSAESAAAPKIPPQAMPLVGDAFEPPTPTGLTTAGQEVIAAAPGYNSTSEFMIGKVAVGVILPESNGGTENWDSSRQTTVFNKIVAGLNWWATKGGSKANLTFYYDQKFNIPTQYEPINMQGSSDEYLWVSDIFSNMGYTSGDRFSRAKAYINSIRTTYGTDWCYAFIVVDSLNDADGIFADGQYFAWAYLGGPYVIMTYDNDGWGISNMNWVASHETGHIFLAADEYCDPGYACCDFGYYGYLNVYNGNCEKNNPSSVDCIMKNNNNVVCSYTNGQVGWRDTDGDGKPDPIDNVVNNTLNNQTTPTRQTVLTFTGTAVDVPYNSPTRTDVTINKISSVKYRIDGAAWVNASASDGSFDEDTEGYTFTTPTLDYGVRLIETQAWSTSGNSSDIRSQNVDIQVTITASAGSNGSVSPSGTFGVSKGNNVLFTATANSGYNVDKWYLDGGVVQTGGNTYLLSNITANHTVYVTFRIPTLPYTITATAGSGGSVSPSGTFDVNQGEDVPFTANPSHGYEVDTWYLDGGSIQTGGNTYLLSNVTANHTVYVTFSILPQYTVTSSAGANGSIEPAGETLVYYGDDMEFTAAANPGYKIDTWYVDSNSVQTGGNTYLLSDITANHTVYVTFSILPPKYSITATAGSGGSVSPSGTFDVNQGDNVLFTATASNGYNVDLWYLDYDIAQTGGNTYTLTNIIANHTVYVTFTKVPVYVDANSPNDPGTGTRSDPFRRLQDGIDAAEADGLEVWVAAGTYRPTTGSSRTISFVMKQGVAVYGGFVGSETQRNQRDWVANNTILSGDIGIQGNNSDNSYNVVKGANNAILDGFTITGGNAVGSSSGEGGGMVNSDGSLSINNCTFTGNTATYGGGMYNSDCSPTITNCIFNANSADECGGGMYNSDCSPTITNCAFSGNTATYDGGGMVNTDLWSPGPSVTGCLFINNTSTYNGGGMDNYDSSPAITNCTFSGNSATTSGGGIFNSWLSSSAITNCILWGNVAPDGPQIYNIDYSNPSVTYSDVEGGWTGTGNFNTNPLFANPAEGDYHLKSIAGRWDPNAQTWVKDTVHSVCIDAGSPASDWTAELWPHGKRINVGTFCGTPQASMSTSTAGNIADFNGDGRVDYADLETFRGKWLWETVLLAEDLNRDGKVDFTDCAIFANQWLWTQP